MKSVLAMDIGGTRIKTARVSADGVVQSARQEPTPSDLESFLKATRGMLAGLRDGETAAAGFGCKGIVNPQTTVVEVLPGPLSYLQGFALKELAGGLPSAADNDARVAMAGEIRWGAARGCSNALMFTLGTGVGGAILSDGRIVRGATGVAGHVGHLTVETGGEWCICGNRGCLETVFSAKAIESAAAAVVHRGVACALRPGMSCAEVFAAAEAGDPIAGSIVSESIQKLGGAIAALVFALDPERIIIGGQISEAGNFLLEPLRREVWWRTRSLLRREVEMIRSELADPSGVLGAAAIAFDHAAAL